MGDIVIVAYRPKASAEGELLELIRGHASELRALGLVTDRPAQVMKARDGTFLELFEWETGGIDKAHQHPAVLATWERFAVAADYLPLKDLPEAGELFAQFEPVYL